MFAFDKNEVNRSGARLHVYKSYNYNVIITFFFGGSFDKQVIVKKTICN